MKRLMLNGNQLLTGDSTIILNKPYTLHSSMQITVSQLDSAIEGDFQWVYLTLPLSIGNVINEVKIYYANSNIRSHISQVRLTQSTTPNVANVIYDDQTRLDQPGQSPYVNTANKGLPCKVEGSMVLELKLNITNLTDIISVEAIEIGYLKKEPFVNVQDFGAVGLALETKGSIKAGLKALTVNSVNDWVIGAGIGIAGAAADGSALVTRVTWIDSIQGTLNLKDASANTIDNAIVTSDDSLPIQDAINSLDNIGGTIWVPSGTYMIGTTGSKANKPIVLTSNIRIIGAGKGATILQLCQEANMLFPADSSIPLTGLRMAGPIFMNASNFWWFNLPSNPQLPYYGLPYDSNIEIAGITFDGDKNHQTLVYEPQYNPNPTSMPNPTNSVQLTGIQDAAGQLPPGTATAPAVYEVFLRFQDAAGNEGTGIGAYASFPYYSDPNPPTKPYNFNAFVNFNALLVSLPPVFPKGSAAVVPYIRRADHLLTSTNPVNEVDTNTNLRYERLDPVLLSSIPLWDGNPDPSHWPTIKILAHTLYPQKPLDPLKYINTQGNYRFPGIVNFSGNTGASYFGDFRNGEKFYFHDIEIRNFVSDGFGLDIINFSKFDRIHTHHNGRHGLNICSDQIEEVDFNECIFEGNESWAVDMEPIASNGLRWNRCTFLNNNAGVGINAAGITDCQNIEFNTCLFDGNSPQITSTGAKMNIINLKIKDCTFRNNIGNCILFHIADIPDLIVMGEITGCEFDQANGYGTDRSFGPGYDLWSLDESAINLQGLNTTFRITNNHFKPWAVKQTGEDGIDRLFASSQYMIDISSTAGGHSIHNNHFESNPLDTRPSAYRSVYGTNSIKNQHFLFSYFEQLSSNKISGNIGDGLIWTESGNPQDPNPPQPPIPYLYCGLDLEERGSIPAAPGSSSLIVPFVYSLPGNYLVAASFNWNTGAWWVSDVTPSGFTINWEIPPVTSFIPKINWSAKFVS